VRISVARRLRLLGNQIGDQTSLAIPPRAGLPDCEFRSPAVLGSIAGGTLRAGIRYAQPRLPGLARPCSGVAANSGIEGRVGRLAGGPSCGWDPAAEGRGGGGWKMTAGLHLGRKRHSEIGVIFWSWGRSAKGRQVGKAEQAPPDPLATVEQRNGWRASLVPLFRCSAVSSEWHPTLENRHR
jgi:hypothetical protein